MALNNIPNNYVDIDEFLMDYEMEEIANNQYHSVWQIPKYLRDDEDEITQGEFNGSI